MSEDPTFPNPTQMLFAEDFLVSHSVTRESSKLKATPDISGRRCLGLSGNAGRLGLLEKTLLESSTWAWTKYSLTWKAKATPQGRLIFQLVQWAPRTFGSASGLLHTPTAKANQTAPSMATQGSGNWVSNLWPTPRVSMSKGPSSKEIEAGDPKRRLETAVHMWPTPDATPRGATPTFTGTRPSGAKESFNLETAVTMWPTPNAREKGGGEYQDPDKIKARMEKGYQANLGDVVKLDQKSGGQLSPLWVAWLMGYPTEYLNSVPWGTQSSRKSRKKSETQ